MTLEHCKYVNIAINCIDQNRKICIINITSASYYVLFNVDLKCYFILIFIYCSCPDQNRPVSHQLRTSDLLDFFPDTWCF